MHRTMELSIHVVLYDGHRWHVNLIEDVFAGPRRSTRELSRKTFTSKANALDYIEHLVGARMDEVRGTHERIPAGADRTREAPAGAQQFTA
jgi:hypothetical protein